MFDMIRDAMFGDYETTEEPMTWEKFLEELTEEELEEFFSEP